jgi:hypothetical protein
MLGININGGIIPSHSFVILKVFLPATGDGNIDAILLELLGIGEPCIAQTPVLWIKFDFPDSI